MFKAFEFCLPTNATKVPAGQEWLHEIRYDGYHLTMKHIARWLAMIAAALLTGSATAAQIPKSYLCEVKNIYELGDAGAIQSTVRRGNDDNRFQIKIKTGEMIGSGSLRSSGWAKTLVLDPGTSPSGSFLKVMYSSPPGSDFTNVGYLEIQGTVEQLSRPFLYNQGGSLYSGVCIAAF
jgi:hypothetical protein